MNQLKDPKFKSNLMLATYVIGLAFILLNIKVIGRFLGGLFGVLSPFIIGIVIAFVFNIPMKFLEDSAFKPLLTKERSKKLIRPLALTSTIILIFGVITSIIIYIVPQLGESSATLVKNVPEYVKSLEEFMNQYMSSTELLNTVWQQVLSMGEKIISLVGQVTGNILNQILGITMGLTSVIFNIIMGLLIGIYILLGKEKLKLQSKKLLYATMDIEKADKIMDLARLTQLKFSKFVAGQVIEAIILGVLCFIGMVIFRMPYAILISTLIAVTALIPIFGSLIGTIPGAFIILMVEPTKALWFVVLIVVIQQIEGNLIYPIVVGNSIGLSALWVLLAITVGGGYFGVAGMLIGVPLFGVIYTVLSSYINSRLKKKSINVQDLEEK